MRTTPRHAARRLAPLLSACLLAVFAVACSRGTDPAASKGLVRVAAAASLRAALPDLIAAFQSGRPGVRVEATYGSSGNLYAQASAGAPFDVLLAADDLYPARLVTDGRASPDGAFVYGVGRLVLWVPSGSALDVGKGYAILDDERVRRIGIANARLAPYGAAAEAAMARAGVLERARPRLVVGENISQVAQYADTGMVDVAFLALSLAVVPPLLDHGQSMLIPATDHPALRQAGVVLADAADPEAAASFAAFLRTDAAAAILRRFGYEAPGE